MVRYGKAGNSFNNIEMEESKYKFLNPSLWKGVTADEAMKELDRIREKYGLLKPETIVEESRDEAAVLHKCFQWDDTLAAEAWRKEQARHLVSNITVVVKTEYITTNVRAIVNVCDMNSPNRSYIPMAKAINDKNSYEDLLSQAKRDMETFISKYTFLSELDKVRQAMSLVLSDFNQ